MESRETLSLSYFEPADVPSLGTSRGKRFMRDATTSGLMLSFETTSRKEVD